MSETQQNTILYISLAIIGSMFTFLSAILFAAVSGLRETISKLFQKVDDARERLKAVESVCQDRHKED